MILLISDRKCRRLRQKNTVYKHNLPGWKIPRAFWIWKIPLLENQLRFSQVQLSKTMVLSFNMIKSIICLKAQKKRPKLKMKILSHQSHLWKLRFRKPRKKMRKIWRGRKRKRKLRRKRRRRRRRNIMINSRKMKEPEYKINSKNMLKLVKRKFLKNQIHQKNHNLFHSMITLQV